MILLIEMMEINRGGHRISIVKSTSHHVPTITIGHIDQNGKDKLDTMLKGSYTVDEIVEYFKQYVNGGQAKSYRSSRYRSRQTSVDPEADADQTNISNVNDSLKTVDRRKKNAEQINKCSKQTSLGNLINVTAQNSRNIASEQKLKSKDLSRNNENDANDHSEENISKLVSQDDIKKTTKGNMKTKSRYVFDILDADYLKRTIPYMHPSSKHHTFRFFEDQVHDVVDGKGLVEDDVLDVMQFRMGGSYLAEMKQLRDQRWDLEYVEKYYLQKDLEMETAIRKKKQLIEKSNKVRFISRLIISTKIDENVEMKRMAIKDMWGVNISYTKRLVKSSF